MSSYGYNDDHREDLEQLIELFGTLPGWKTWRDKHLSQSGINHRVGRMQTIQYAFINVEKGLLLDSRHQGMFVRDFQLFPGFPWPVFLQEHDRGLTPEYFAGPHWAAGDYLNRALSCLPHPSLILEPAWQVGLTDNPIHGAMSCNQVELYETISKLPEPGPWDALAAFRELCDEAPTLEYRIRRQLTTMAGWMASQPKMVNLDMAEAVGVIKASRWTRPSYLRNVQRQRWNAGNERLVYLPLVENEKERKIVYRGGYRRFAV